MISKKPGRLSFISSILLILAILFSTNLNLVSSISSSEINIEPIYRQPITFIETFDGSPNTPERFRPENFSVDTLITTVKGRPTQYWYQIEESTNDTPHQGQHGPNCERPVSLETGELVTHDIIEIEDVVYKCKDHIMTAYHGSAASGAVYLTPNHMVDFSQGEATIRFDVSTDRGEVFGKVGGYDWLEFFITPYDENLMHPFSSATNIGQGQPGNTITVQQPANGINKLTAKVVKNFVETEVPSSNLRYETLIDPSPITRTTFEIKINKDLDTEDVYLSVGMINYDGDGSSYYWVDNENIGPLTWDKGIFQFGQVEWNIQQPCNDEPCNPNTWHWDNLIISPAIPFTMIKADRRYVERDDNQIVNFADPAPANSHLRFSGIGENIEISVDNGNTWIAANKQPQQENREVRFSSYWTPIPAGVDKVMFRADGYTKFNFDWHIRDMSIWSTKVGASEGGGNTSTPTPTPTLVEKPSPTTTPTIVPTNIPTPTVSGPSPTLTPSPTSTPPSPTPGNSRVLGLGVVFPAGTTATTLSLTTDSDAVCKYDTQDIDYSDMISVFDNTGGTSHSTVVSGLEDGNSYTYDVKCKGSGLFSKASHDVITFTIESNNLAQETESEADQFSPTATPTSTQTPTPTNSITPTPTITQVLGLNTPDLDLEPIVFHEIPGRIQAEDFTTGSEGVAYHDTTTKNQGKAPYRDPEAVDIALAYDEGGTYYVGWIRQGEWLKYDLVVTEAGSYDITARIAALYGKWKDIEIIIDEDTPNEQSFSVKVPSTGGWQIWEDAIFAQDVHFTEGFHTMTVVLSSRGINFNYFDVLPSSD